MPATRMLGANDLRAYASAVLVSKIAKKFDKIRAMGYIELV